MVLSAVVTNMVVNIVLPDSFYDCCFKFRMTLFCYHKVVAWEWTARGLPGISYHRLRLAWIAFQKLMDFGAPMEDNFECIQCGRSPRQIVCDGITLSFQKRYLTEVLHQEMSGDNSGLLSGSR